MSLLSKIKSFFSRGPTRREQLLAINVEIEQAKGLIKLARRQGDRVAATKYREQLAEAVRRFNDINVR